MVLCGLSIAGFTLSVFLDVVTRELGRPWLWLQLVTTGFFAWGVFIGMAVATRRLDHLNLVEITKGMSGPKRSFMEISNRLVILAGRAGDGGVRLPEFPARHGQLPRAVADPARHLHGERADLRRADRAVLHRADRQRLAPRLRGAGRRGRFRGDREMGNGTILLIMTALFLGFGYMGVPVAFALMAGVLVACSLTPISMQSMVGQMFHGIDSEILLAVPFFLLVGELMTSADVTNRMIRLAQTMVGHLRGGLAQVVTLFSMFFAGISGSSTADVAVLSRTVAPEMTKEGYDRAFTAALIACASTMANLIPPSIMAVVYGATGNVSIGGLFLAGIVPGVLIGIGLMIYSHFFGPVGIRKPRASLCEFADAARASVLPLMIPLIIMGGILTGWFTPTEAGMIAVGLYPASCSSRCSIAATSATCRATSSTPGCSTPCRSRWSRPRRRSAGCSPICAAPISSPAGSSCSPAMTAASSCCCWCCCSS